MNAKKPIRYAGSFRENLKTREQTRGKYQFYNSDLTETTRLFGGISPKDVLQNLIAQKGSATVLELGCGKGRTLKQLKMGGAKLFGTNLEREPEFLKHPARIRICEFGELPKKFKPESIDLAYSNLGLGHSQNLVADLERVKGLLKPGGQLIFNTTHMSFMQNDLPASLDRMGLRIVRVESLPGLLLTLHLQKER